MKKNSFREIIFTGLVSLMICSGVCHAGVQNSDTHTDPGEVFSLEDITTKVRGYYIKFRERENNWIVFLYINADGSSAFRRVDVVDQNYRMDVLCEGEDAVMENNILSLNLKCMPSFGWAGVDDPESLEFLKEDAPRWRSEFSFPLQDDLSLPLKIDFNGLTRDEILYSHIVPALDNGNEVNETVTNPVYKLRKAYEEKPSWDDCTGFFAPSSGGIDKYFCDNLYQDSSWYQFWHL